MRFVAILAGLVFLFWITHDSEALHVVSTQIADSKHAVLMATCPPTNGSWACHVVVRLLY